MTVTRDRWLYVITSALAVALCAASGWYAAAAALAAILLVGAYLFYVRRWRRLSVALLSAAIVLSGVSAGAQAAALGLSWYGGHLQRRGQLDAARTCWEQALVVADHVGGPHGLTQSLATRLGDLALSQGRCDAAGARYREALARAGWHGNGRHVALIRTRLGDAARCRGDAVAALVHYERALAVCRGANIIERQPDIYLALGDLHREQGQYEQALALYRQGLAKAELTDTAADQAALLHRVGLIQRLRGDRAGARERFEAARAHYRRVATPSTDQARLLADLGGLHQAEGRYYHALRYYTEALATWQAAGPAGVAATGAIEMSALARALIDEGEADLACIHYQEVLVLTLGQRRAAAPVPPLPPMPPDISDPAN